ncbi:hypothetical protein LTR91_022862 [Friedmanniomyces endolithicus]|uniref:Ankyrin repeat protein n=1 Tax=Friedmanniomyces endolithicus TaxID=329885 RepID=A0AAN6K218_9PEZI|nr:hypothetical protein LTR91_022862 [Friedmanniomyces endolithicus]
MAINDCRDGRTLLPQHQEQQATIDLDDIESETSSLADVTSGLNLGSSAGEGSLTPPLERTDEEIMAKLYLDPVYRQTMYMSHCCLREVPELQLLCRRYPDDQLIGCVDEEGNTGALLAATEEGGLEILRWLQRHGDSITLANHYGRTPLMEAALWGRLSTVQYLTRQSIDREFIGAPIPKINAFEHFDPINGTRRAFFNRRADGTLEVYRPQVLLQPPGRQDGLQKAFATLDRGPNYPYVNAMSGYTHAGWPNVLDNSIWTDKAETLRAILDLPENRRAASHVEPQLLAYLLDRHSLHALADRRERQELLSVMPTYSLRPIITVSKSEFCPFCRELFERFRANFPEFGVTLQCIGESAIAPLDVLE